MGVFVVGWAGLGLFVIGLGRVLGFFMPGFIGSWVGLGFFMFVVGLSGAGLGFFTPGVVVGLGWARLGFLITNTLQIGSKDISQNHESSMMNQQTVWQAGTNNDEVTQYWYLVDRDKVGFYRKYRFQIDEFAFTTTTNNMQEGKLLSSLLCISEIEFGTGNNAIDRQ